MFRRCTLAVAGLALGLLVGCGPVIRTSWKIDAARVKAEWALMPNRLDYTVYQPSHRVALATFETLKAELAEVKIRNVELTVDKNYDTSEGKPPVMGEFEIPKDHPAFWFEGLPDTKAPTLVNCWKVAFSGKTKEGQKVEAQVRLEIVGSDRRTVVSVQVGSRGDATGSKNLIDRISERIQNPSTRPGSPEESAALKAAFDPGPKGMIDVSEETGEITIKMG
jgi:hypothetical protein